MLCQLRDVVLKAWAGAAEAELPDYRKALQLLLKVRWL